MTETHEHQWAADSFHAGFGCVDCQASYWDWSQAELSRLRGSQVHCHCDADVIGNQDAELTRLNAEVQRLAAEIEIYKAADYEILKDLCEQCETGHCHGHNCDGPICSCCLTQEDPQLACSNVHCWFHLNADVPTVRRHHCNNCSHSVESCPPDCYVHDDAEVPAASTGEAT